MKLFSTMKYVTLLLKIFFFTCPAYSQFKVHHDGSTTVNSFVGNWGSAMRTTVHNPQACSYHLQYGNVDRFYVSAEGWLWCQQGGWFGSDFKIKKNINKIQSPISTIRLLRGIQFDYRNIEPKSSEFNQFEYDKLEAKPNIQRLGLIAQDVEKVLPGIVKTLNDSSKAIAYTDIIALLIEGIKEQQNQLDSIRITLNLHNNLIISVNEIIKNCNHNCCEKQFTNSAFTNEALNKNMITTLDAELFENSPNPFNIDTKISFFIPDDMLTAKLIIHDLQGLELKSIDITQKGYGSITIVGSEFNAGIYLYSLLLNNKKIQTKRMILTKE